MDKQEKIVCAAVQINCTDNYDRTYFGEFVGIYHNDAYIDESLAIFRFDIESTGREIVKEQVIDGFMTNKNRFVDAKEAMEIAIRQDQIAEINDCFDELTKAHANEDFRKVNELLNKLQALKVDCASRELKPEDLY